MTRFDLTTDPYAEIMKKIDVSGRPTRGNKDAKVTIVNYDDFECPFCSRMHATLFPGLFKEYGDRVLFIYKDYPIEEIHPWAMHAAVDANCLAAQNNDAYWEYADYLHGNRKRRQRRKTATAGMRNSTSWPLCRRRSITSTFRSCRHASRLRMKRLCAPRCTKAKPSEWKPLQPCSSTDGNWMERCRRMTYGPRSTRR